MTSRGFLQIPSRDHSGLSKLLLWDDEKLKELLDILAKKTPTLSIEGYISYATENTNIEQTDVEEMMLVLMNTYLAKAEMGISTSDYIDIFLRAVEETGVLRVAPNKGDQGYFKDRLKLLLSFDKSIGVISKAALIYTQHTNVFREARIFTDIRPVFGEDTSSEPIGGLIIHKLMITFSRDKEPQEMYFALDGDDIRNLKEILSRAEDKERAIIRFMRTSSLTTMEGEDIDG